ncbi:hypothetical protein evm_001911 [Chilo suppressalis]|nr:hypothetical protein evm_001911 [Chilo suppressalis]
MAAVSKHLYNDLVEDMACHNLFHPWTESCVKSWPKVLADTTIGSTRFYTIIYLIQILMQGKKLKHKRTWRNLMEYFVRSTLLGTAIPFSYIVFNCVFGKIGIKKSYFTTLLLPFTINGLFIYLEPPHRRSLVVNLFVNLLIEYCLKCLSRSGYIEMTKSKQTLMFMIGSAFLFYLMRLEGDKPKRTPLFWLYTAEKVKRKTDDSSKIVCPHKGICWKYILKGSSTYFGIGLAISLAKLILPKIRTPIKALSSIRGKNFKLAMFFGSYIGIYRAVMCYLCNKTKRDDALYALPAGYVAGLSMMFNPSTGLAIASLTAAFKLYSTILYEKKILPDNVPLPELMYCLCQGILFSSRLVDLGACPSYILNLMDTVSHGHCEAVFQRVVAESKRLASS